MTAPPFENLSPDAVLDAVDSTGLRTDGRLLALNSYENRVYQLGIEDAAPVVVKFYRPERWTDTAILEEHHFVAQLADAEIPAVPALTFGTQTLLTHRGFRFSIFPRHGGRAPELDNEQTLAWLGRFLARIHVVGVREPFEHRQTVDLATLGEASRDWLLAHNMVAPELLTAWHGTVDQAIEGVRRCFERTGQVRTLRLHGDCHAGNVLWTDDGPHFVDFDDARHGPAIQDLWMLLSGERTTMERQLSAVLRGYTQFRDFDRSELMLIEALRTLRLIHYSAWIARRWHDPAFPVAFPWFGSTRYWQDRILELKEQIALMDEPPLYPML